MAYILTDKMKLKEAPMTEEEKKLDHATRVYVEMRDERAAKKRAWAAEDADLKSRMDTIEAFLLGTCQSLGVESFRTAHGTVYQSIDVKPSCGDWQAFYSFIKENDAFDALEKRVKKSFITEYMEANADELPPGISVTREYTVTVRRK